jgi:hypothetical protein
MICQLKIKLSYGFYLNMSNFFKDRPSHLRSHFAFKEILVYRTLKNAVYTEADELSLMYANIPSYPKEISNLKNLTNLNLSFNEFKIIPKEIGLLTNLKFLDLQENVITTIHEDFGNLKNLTELFLQGNLLSELPYSFNNLQNLRVLDLSKNEFKAIPSVIGTLGNLKYIQIHNSHELHEWKYYTTEEIKREAQKLSVRCILGTKALKLYQFADIEYEFLNKDDF